MVKTWKVSSGKTVGMTIADLREVFLDWGIEPVDWQAKALAPGTGYEVKWWLPHEKEPHVVNCSTQATPAENLRACFHNVENQQVSALRGVQARYGDTIYLRAIEGEVGGGYRRGPARPPVASPQRKANGFRNLSAACQFLGLAPDADRDIVDAVLRAMVKKHHPDQGGSADMLKKVLEAKDMVYARRGWEIGQETPGGVRVET